MKRTLVSMLLFLVSVASFAVHSGNAKLDRAVEKANSDWVAAMKTGDAAAIAAPYADDAVFVGMDGASIRGRVEIEKMYRARFERMGLARSTRIDSKNLVGDGISPTRRDPARSDT